MGTMSYGVNVDLLGLGSSGLWDSDGLLVRCRWGKEDGMGKVIGQRSSQQPDPLRTGGRPVTYLETGGS